MKMGKMPTMPKFHAPKVATKIHPAAQMRVRLPQGMANTKAGDPGVYAPGVGKI
jgi:hypothetical protein